jgi:NAD(P)-dependent dehydrogenase (short-subunit alcohol dehydrogenase family)
MSKVLLVTGSSRGIGAETVRLAAANDYAICVNYHKNKSAAEALVKSLGQTNQPVIIERADISQETDVIRLFSAIDKQLGPLTSLVNNAGILEDQRSVVDMTVDRLTRVFATNITGSFLCCREAVKRMSTSSGGPGGSIVNLSSRAAVLGAAHEYVDYAASKGAIDSLTIGLANEVGTQGIRVNAVRPGLIYTDIHADSGEPDRVDRLKTGVPMKRGGTVREVAESILWLLSDAASYTTGSFIDVSGGR